MPYFRIDGVPVAKGRPRSTRAGAIYTPKKTAAWEAMIRTRIGYSLNRVLMDGPLRVSMTFHMPMPKSLHKSVREAVKAGQGTAYHSVRPDADNLAKAILDACNGILWRDDAQVADLSVMKVYSVNPGVELTVTSA